jgi:hypothetical protein
VVARKKKFKSSKNIEGMIRTEWNQRYPFNKKCPVITDTLALVGCTPLALAQVMKKWEWPVNGIGKNTDSWPDTSLETINFSTTTYDYNNMPQFADSSSSSVVQEAVSTLCYHSGAALNASYGIKTTSAYSKDVPHIISSHFNYTSQLESKAVHYPDSTFWIDSLKASMLAGIPVIYSSKWYSTDASSHTWIVDDYRTSTDEFHFNMGWWSNSIGFTDTLSNDWYPTITYIKNRDAGVFYILPDHPNSALSIPFFENFEKTLTSATDEFNQIPRHFGVDKSDGISVKDNIGFNNTKAFKRSCTYSENSFFIKKINLLCDSVPILKFNYKISNYGEFGEGDSLRIEISDNNRLTWNRIASIDHSNFNNTAQYKDKIISLNDYRNEIINIKFHFYSKDVILPTDLYEWYFDNLEVGKLDLKFTEIINDTIMPPRTAQPIKVTPSTETPPKSKGYENYDMKIDFYIAKDGDSYPFFPNFTDSICENGIFEYPNWNTDDSLGVTFKIRAVARTKSNNTALKSTEVRVKISGRQCSVDLPLPATETWFDFETRLNVAGSILAESSFVDSLSNVYVAFDIYDDYWSAYLSEMYQEEIHFSIFDEDYAGNNLFIDSNVYFCDFEKKAQALNMERKLASSELRSKKKNTMKFTELSKPKTSDNNSKDFTVYPAVPYRYPRSLDLWPGSYTVHMIAFRKDIWDTYGVVSEIAKCDSLQFIIPLWKMKLRRDYWFANTEVPYKQNLEYEAGKTMQILLWQPISWGPYNILNIDVVRETDNAVVKNFAVDFNNKAGGVMVEWNIPPETVPGFYNLKASNVDYYTGIPVNQQIDPQVCPLYLSWENYGNWPNNWPGSDNADWEIKGAPWTPAMGAYALAAKYSTEGNTGEVSIQKSVSIGSEWDNVLEFAIGVHKFYGVNNFDPLLANYSIATSIDGANWTIEKTADINDYLIYNWSLDAMYCFNKYFKPLGQISSVGVKFIKNGIVTAPPDSQSVLFDEVKVVLSKTPLKTGPTNPSAQYAGGNVNVGWSGAAKSDKAVDSYYIYRNGFKVGETTSVSFVDSTVSANTFYNYAITAHYDDGSAYPESPMNECSVSIYTGLYSPSNLVITNENPNIRLTWSPVSGASEYKVYSSNDPYGTFAEDASGTFNGEEWVAPINTSRLFYYVVAVNESMKEKKIKEESLSRVK